MKKIIGIVIGAAILLFLVLGIARTRQSEEALSITKIQQREGIPVFVRTVEKGDVEKVRSYYGTVRAKHQALVSSKLMDRIDKILVSEGDRVKKGQVLVRFDTTATQASVTQARLQFNNSKRDYDRMKKLFDEGAISRQTLDQVELGYRVAQKNYETALHTIELIAPISGIVARVDFEAGAIAFPGDVIVKIVNDENYDVAFDVTQEDRGLLKPGQNVMVYLDGDDGVAGEISHVGLATSDRSRLFTAYANIPAASNMYPGVLATVNVTVEHRDDVVQVPMDAILDRGDGPFVFVIENGTAKKRVVKTGLQGEDAVEILSGLNAGETVATYGHKAIEDGAKVKIVEEAKSAGE